MTHQVGIDEINKGIAEHNCERATAFNKILRVKKEQLNP